MRIIILQESISNREGTGNTKKWLLFYEKGKKIRQRERCQAAEL